MSHSEKRQSHLICSLESEARLTERYDVNDWLIPTNYIDDFLNKDTN